ncbi:DMT family transporter [Streptomyces sp. 900105245]
MRNWATSTTARSALISTDTPVSPRPAFSGPGGHPRRRWRHPAPAPVAEATRSSGGTRGSSLGGTLLGIALGLVAAGTYALYSWAAHRLITRDIPSRAAMGAVFGLGGVLLVPVLLVTGGPLVDSWTNAAVGTYMALVPMFAGYLLFGWGLAHVPASTATTLSLLEPAVAAVLAVLVVGERLPAAGWAGVALVVLCLAVLTLPTGAGGRPSRRGPRRAAGEALPGAAVRDDREHPAGVAGARPGPGGR